jgi:hypothetical protein
MTKTKRKPHTPVRSTRLVRRRKRWLRAYTDALEAEIVMLRACNDMLVAREQQARVICNGLRAQLAATKPNDADQRPRANPAEYETEASSRGSLHLICWAFVPSSSINGIADKHLVR